MKIAIYSGAIPSATFIEHLIKGVSNKHHVFLFGTLNRKHFKAYNNPNVFVYQNEKNKLVNFSLTAFRFLKLAIKYPSRLRPLHKELSTYSGTYNKWVYFSKFLPIVLYKPDIFHIQWAKDVEFYAFLQSAYDIKLVLSLLGSHINYSPIANAQLASVYKKVFPEIDAFHAVSEAIKFEAHKYHAPLEKIKVIRSPIPDLFFNAYKPYVKTQNLKIIKLVSVGRFHWVKGITYAIQAIAILKQDGYEVKYTIIGSQTPSEEILFMIDELSLKNNVHFVSNIGQDKLVELLQQQDILVLPSILEGIANVVLEAMAIGLPVVSTDCGGMNEVVKPNETGWLIPKRNASAIAIAIKDIVQTNDIDLKRITQSAHDFVKKYYSANNSVDEFVRMYQDVLNNKF